MMRLSKRQLRWLLRIIHLIAAGIMGTFVYSPWSDIPAFRFAVEWIVFPLGFVVTGLWMWQMPRITQWRKAAVKP